MGTCQVMSVADASGSKKVTDEKWTRNDKGAGKSQNKSQQSKKMKGKVNKNRPLKVPVTIPKKDHCQRVTYLYKVGSLMLSKQLEKYDSEAASKSVDTLSRKYLNHMNLVSKKAVLKLHPDMKRTLCKQCSRLLVEGVTCTIRLENKSKKQLPHCDVLEFTCTCGTTKRFPVGKDPGYTLFSEKESVLYEMGDRAG